MSWVLIDDNFPTHPKAISAGPLASYLFVCGLCYCRRHHTDGFIPSAAIPTLGMPANPRKLVDALVAVGLWTRQEGGFQVHDYHAIYEADAADKARKDSRTAARREAGRLGGLARAAARSTPQTDDLATSTDDFASSKTLAIARSKILPHRTGTGLVLGSVDSGEGGLGETPSPPDEAVPPFPTWLAELRAAYPPERVTSGYLTESAFHQQFLSDERPAAEVWADMRAGLESQLAGHEWRVKRMVPKLEKWLREGLWRQRHQAEAPVVERLTPKTNRTLAAAAEILRGGGQ